MKKGKNHVSWNENPPQTAAQVVENQARATVKDDSDSERIGSPPRINKTAAVTSSAEYEEMRKKLERLKEEERQVDSYLSSLKEQAEVFNGRRPPSREQTAFLPAGVRNIQESGLPGAVLGFCHRKTAKEKTVVKMCPPPIVERLFFSSFVPGPPLVKMVKKCTPPGAKM